MGDVSEQWYWDRRNKKLYYPVETREDTVVFATAWHREEVADALGTDALVAMEDLGPDYLDDIDAGFDVFESFRTLDDEQLAQFGSNDDD